VGGGAQGAQRTTATGPGYLVVAGPGTCEQEQEGRGEGEGGPRSGSVALCRYSSIRSLMRVYVYMADLVWVCMVYVSVLVPRRIFT